MWAELGRRKLPGNVFSSVTPWLTQKHPTAVSRVWNKSCVTRKSICITYMVSQKSLNFHMLIELQPNRQHPFPSLCIPISRPFRTQEVIYDGSSCSPWQGAQTLLHGSWSTAQTAINLGWLVDNYYPHVTDGERESDSRGSCLQLQEEVTDLRRDARGSTCLLILSCSDLCSRLPPEPWDFAADVQHLDKGIWAQVIH